MSTEQHDRIVVLAEGATAGDRMEYALLLVAEKNAAAEKLDGRRYTKVADRVEVFRRAFGPLALIATEITHVDQDVVRARCEIHLPDGGIRVLVATGHAEEVRGSNDINFYSALENAETSAIGRALANLGLSGNEFASANEIIGARAKEEATKADKGTEFLKSEEITAAVIDINACKTSEQLAETYLKLNPALKVACKAAMNSKHKALSSEPTTGSEPEKAGSQAAASDQPAESHQRRGRKPGAA